MISTDTSGAIDFIDKSELQKNTGNAERALKMVQSGTGLGSEWLGWRRIMKEPNDAEIDDISSLAAEIRNDADVFIVCGIGGSYLGAKAVIDSLKPIIDDEGPKIVYAGHHMSGKYLKELLNYLEKPKADGENKSVYLNVISKSGSTLETALSFRVLRSWINETYGKEAARRIIATTGPEGGILNKLVESEGYKKFVIPDDIGGRYSVLTPVGLLPISVAGIDIQTLYYGAVHQFEKLEEDNGELLEYAAIRYMLQYSSTALDIIGTFEPELSGITMWIQQLLGESEGKDGKGIFPATATYSTDLHSIGQMIQQGKRNAMETLLSVEKPIANFIVPEIKDDVDELNYLAGKSFHEINKSAQKGTTEAHIEGGVPLIRIKIESLNAQQIGELIYFYELFTAVYVYMLGVNPFNQPGVENYKKAMYRILGKS
ncbi:MAG TPA: glucose-6-phosphate isomerase [Balneolaceae bacterium]|nr:glucose-6-phosphate isomerase [Balneolaceae bacterium]